MKFTQNPKVYKYSSSFQQVRKISLFSYYFLLALKLQARRTKCKNVQGKHTHIYLHLVFQTNHFLLLIASGISMYSHDPHCNIEDYTMQIEWENNDSKLSCRICVPLLLLTLYTAGSCIVDANKQINKRINIINMQIMIFLFCSVDEIYRILYCCLLLINDLKSLSHTTKVVRWKCNNKRDME